MSNVIQFLEAAGRGVSLAPIDYAAAVASLDIDEAQRGALIERNHARLSDLLDGRVQMMCIVNAPQQDQEDEFLPDDDGMAVPEEEEVEPLQK